MTFIDYGPCRGGRNCVCARTCSSIDGIQQSYNGDTGEYKDKKQQQDDNASALHDNVELLVNRLRRFLRR